MQRRDRYNRSETLFLNEDNFPGPDIPDNFHPVFCKRWRFGGHRATPDVLSDNQGAKSERATRGIYARFGDQNQRKSSPYPPGHVFNSFDGIFILADEPRDEFHIG